VPTNTAPAGQPPGKLRIPKAIRWGGLICGVLDITAAFIDAKLQFDTGPVRLLQNVAGALLGPATYDGGLATAALGLAMHFSVAYSATTVFYLLSRRFPLLVRWAVPCGLVYGAMVFFVMFRGVVPLTMELKSLYLTTFNHTLPKLRLPQFVIHLFCVGLAIALAVRRFAPVPEASAVTRVAKS
jgi:glucan phosphoethanolaminetransferase (alkaline phosphatase superfamily)